MDLSTLLTFAGAVFLLALTPGPDTALAMRWTLIRDRRAGALVALGSMTGVTVHLTAAALGLSTLLAASATAFTVLKVVGAGYLTWLGLRLLFQRRRGTGPEPKPRSRAPKRERARRGPRVSPGPVSPGPARAPPARRGARGSARGAPRAGTA